MKFVRAIFLACILGGFAVLFFALTPPRHLMEQEGERTVPETNEDILVEGLRYSEWEGDRLLWSMEAERVRYRHKEKKADLEEVDVTFFPATRGKMFLWARQVDFDLETGNLVAQGSIRGKSDQGYTFSTERLFYDGSDRTVSTDDKVTLEKDRLTIEGVGMKGSLADHRFRLLSAVNAVFAPRGSTP